MNPNPVPPRSSRFVFTSLSIAIAHGFISSGYCGSIHFDGSVGSAGALNGPNFLIPADRGKQVGGNLFHSFSDFNLIKDDIATFQGPSNVQNILARVTGGGASSIDGTLRSEISGANLYFINPAGVMFGANAKLDISGSFAVTTADYLKLADGGKFNARLGGDDLLTAAPVSAFGFLSPTPSPVSFTGSQLAVPAGQDFMVVAGDLTLDGAVVAAPSGRLSLVSGGAAGEVPSSPDALAGSVAAVLPAMGSIELKNGAFANIDGNGGGRVVIRGGRLQVVGGSLVRSENRGGAAGGRVDVRVTDSLILREGQIAANTIGAGRGGDVAVEASALSIGGTAFVSGIFAASGSASGARGGDVDVRSDDLALTAGGTISTTTFGFGDCGDMHVAAGRLSIDREGSAISTGLFAAVAPGAIGRGGNIFVESADASILGGGVISGDTDGQGNGGNISVSAAHLRIDPASSGLFTAISSTVLPGAIGDGGDVIVRGDDIAITGGGEISASTFGRGDGGSIDVVATKLRIDGEGVNFGTGIFASVNEGAVGRGGDIIVKSGKLSLLDGGTIFAGTFANGDSGNIRVKASRLRIDDRESLGVTGIFATVGDDAVGHGGNLTVRGQNVSLLHGGAIVADTFGRGDGGSIKVFAPRLRIDQQDSDSTTGIVADVGINAIGNGGRVVVRSDDLAIFRGGQISSNTFGRGDGGSLAITAGRLRIENRGDDSATGIFANVETNARGRGGDIRVRSGALSIVGGGSIAADAAGRGDGGTVSVSASTLLLDGRDLDVVTTISSNVSLGAVGHGGNLIVGSSEITILGGASISTDTSGRGNGGSIQVSARRLFIDGQGADLFTGISSDVRSDGIGRGGDLDVRADGLALFRGGEISAGTFGRGNGGTVHVTAPWLLIDGQNSSGFTGISSDVIENVRGHGGDVVINSSDLLILGGGAITADAGGRDNGGNVQVFATRLRIDGQGRFDEFTGISSDVFEGAVGDGGDVFVRSDALTITGGGRISAETDGRGHGGDIAIFANNFRSDGEDSGVFAIVDESGVGRGGNLLVEAGDLILRNGAEMTADTLGIGSAGSVWVKAGTLRIDGEFSSHATDISSSVLEGATGEGGSVRVAAGELTLRNGGGIAADTLGRGNGGTIEVSASRLRIEGTRGFSTGISSGVGSGAIGHGGDILVTGGEVTFLGTGGITAGTFGGGDAGSVRLRVGDLLIDTSDAAIEGGIFANADAGSTGRGGSVDIVAGTIRIRGNPDSAQDGGIIAQSNNRASAGSVALQAGKIALNSSALITSANLGTGNAGSIMIAARDAVTIDDASLITVFSQGADAGSITLDGTSVELRGGSRVIASAGANGGSITIGARDFVHLDHSTLAATAGSTLAATGAGGAGGNITVDPIFIILDHATISANAALGRGGNILLRADNFLSSESLLTASGSTAGTVEIAAPELDLAAGLVILPGALIDASTQLRELCAARLGLDFSSFLVIGRGGVSLSPDEALPSATLSR